MKRAQAKDDLQGCTFSLGDAENIPCATDRFDRYVSAWQYRKDWPDPQQGIREAYRVVKAGGMALVIGPLGPENPLVRFIARTWMLFPREQDYREWFAAAGFVDIQVQYIRPQWYRGREEYGIAIAGVKPKPGPPPDVPSAPSETIAANMTVARRMQLAGRVLVGSFFGLLFIPMALVGHVKSMGSSPIHSTSGSRETERAAAGGVGDHGRYPDRTGLDDCVKTSTENILWCVDQLTTQAEWTSRKPLQDIALTTLSYRWCTAELDHSIVAWVPAMD